MQLITSSTRTAPRIRLSQIRRIKIVTFAIGSIVSHDLFAIQERLCLNSILNSETVESIE
jgi:hypothetical protein